MDDTRTLLEAPTDELKGVMERLSGFENGTLEIVG